MNLSTHNTFSTPQALPASLMPFVTCNKTAGRVIRPSAEDRAMADALRDASAEYGAESLALMFSFDEEI